MKTYSLIIFSLLLFVSNVRGQTKVDTLDIDLNKDRIYAIISSEYYDRAINDTTGTSDELYYDFSYYAREIQEEEPELVKFFVAKKLFVGDKSPEVDDVIYIFVKDGKYEKHRYIVGYNALDYYKNRMGKQ